MTNPNDSAYPIFLQNGLTHDSHVDTGLLKQEEALLRITCAIVQGLWANAPHGEHHGWSDQDIVESASSLTNAYFNELNKQ